MKAVHPVCPRCNSPWSNQPSSRSGVSGWRYCSSNCGMQINTYGEDAGDDCIILSFGRKYAISWANYRETCFVFTNTSNDCLILPMLPFDITLDQLEKYLMLM